MLMQPDTPYDREAFPIEDYPDVLPVRRRRFDEMPEEMRAAYRDAFVPDVAPEFPEVHEVEDTGVWVIAYGDGVMLKMTFVPCEGSAEWIMDDIDELVDETQQAPLVYHDDRWYIAK